MSTTFANNFVGERKAGGVRFGIVVAEFNRIFCERLLDGAVKAISTHGGETTDISVVWVPGSYELPLAAQYLADSKQIDAIIALGVLIKGETDHYQYVASEACAGLTRVMLSSGIPVSLGIIPALNVQQVEERSQLDEQQCEANKGWEAACAAMQMVDLGRQLAGVSEVCGG